jgi:hypothetical protein
MLLPKSFRVFIIFVFCYALYACSSPTQIDEELSNKIAFDLPAHFSLESVTVTDDLVEVDSNDRSTSRFKFIALLKANEAIASGRSTSLGFQGERYHIGDMLLDEGETLEFAGTGTRRSYRGETTSIRYSFGELNPKALRSKSMFQKDSGSNAMFTGSDEHTALKNRMDSEIAEREAKKEAEIQARLQRDEERLLARESKVQEAQQKQLAIENSIKETRAAFSTQIAEIYKAYGQVVVDLKGGRLNGMYNQGQFFNQTKNYLLLRKLVFEEGNITGESWNIGSSTANKFTLQWLKPASYNNRDTYRLQFNELDDSVIWGNELRSRDLTKRRIDWSVDDAVAADGYLSINLNPKHQSLLNKNINVLLPPWGEHAMGSGTYLMVGKGIFDLSTNTFLAYLDISNFNVGQVEDISIETSGAVSVGDYTLIYPSPMYRFAYAAKQLLVPHEVDYYNLVVQDARSAIFYANGDFFYASEADELTTENFNAQTRRLTNSGVYQISRGPASSLFGNYFYFNRADGVDQIDVTNGNLKSLSSSHILHPSQSKNIISQAPPVSNRYVVALDKKSGRVSYFDKQTDETIIFNNILISSDVRNLKRGDVTISRLESLGNSKYVSVADGNITSVLFLDFLEKKIYPLKPTIEELIYKNVSVDPANMNSVRFSGRKSFFQDENGVTSYSQSKQRILFEVGGSFKDMAANKNVRLPSRYYIFDTVSGGLRYEVTDILNELKTDSEQSPFGGRNPLNVTWVNNEYLLTTIRSHPDVSKIGVWLYSLETKTLTKVISRVVEYCGKPEYIEDIDLVFYCKKEPDGSEVLGSFKLDGTGLTTYTEIKFASPLRLLN